MDIANDARNRNGVAKALVVAVADRFMVAIVLAIRDGSFGFAAFINNITNEGRRPTKRRSCIRTDRV
ncbi:MAG TPA: hypothetical protein PKA82_07855 [Pyrinomonadaceae bacterium]|nr:hypothetical protein [Pyrinomonadaceae bacterium]